MRTAWKATPTLCRTCAHCCSRLNAAHGSADQWRILVGPDAHKIDELVRRSPERAYDVDFFEQFAREVGWPCLPDIAPTRLSPPAEREARGPYLDRRQKAREVHMTEFAGRIAVVTGGGSGMGRELV